jgi:hypothetical protein
VLHGFDPRTEELKIELPLKPVPLDGLRSLFDVGDDLEMYDAYPLDAAKAGRARAAGKRTHRHCKVRLFLAAVRLARQILTIWP